MSFLNFSLSVANLHYFFVISVSKQRKIQFFVSFSRSKALLAVFYGIKKGFQVKYLKTFSVLRRLDSNERPPGYEPGELPTAPLRDLAGAKVRLFYNTPKKKENNLNDFTLRINLQPFCLHT